jgi:hypothetical protein
MKYLLMIIVIFLSCSKPMTNDQIIAEIVKCRKAGLGVKQIKNYDKEAAWIWQDNYIVRIECYPCSSEVNK